MRLAASTRSRRRATTPNEAAADAAVGSAVVGTVLGAAVGGILGGGEGARVGAGLGLFTGGAVGAGNAQAASYTSQQRLDSSYYQCMYSQGHKVPMPASYARSMRQVSAGPAPAPYVSAPPRNAAIPPPNAPPPNTRRRMQQSRRRTLRRLTSRYRLQTHHRRRINSVKF